MQHAGHFKPNHGVYFSVAYARNWIHPQGFVYSRIQDPRLLRNLVVCHPAPEALLLTDLAFGVEAPALGSPGGLGLDPFLGHEVELRKAPDQAFEGSFE